MRISGGAFGAAHAGMTGGDVWRGATNSAMLWAAGEYANMYIGHMVGGMASGKEAIFENGVFYYDTNWSSWITFSNAVTGPYKQLDYTYTLPDGRGFTYKQHEGGHVSPQGTLLGPAYIPAHAASLTVGGLVGFFTGNGIIRGSHRFGFLERSWQPAPSYY